VPSLVSHFVEKHAGKLGKDVPGVTDDAMARLIAYAWPGNVRELENEIERAVLLADAGHPITGTDLSEPFADTDVDAGHGSGLRGRTDAIQRAEIQAALERNGGRRAPAAKELGMSTRGLLKAMHRLGLVETS
jgi:transcriptional regulator with PAS, ATPase and Fis domain